MRRSSNAQLQTQTSEPLIVVEDQEEEDEEQQKSPDYANDSEDESPTMNPYLLSPYARDIRKHSLPTPQCSGITASQVRRLSERGETVGPGPRQAEFLATLSTSATPTPGGRRHSVVTISKVPTTLFGRSGSRRESVAAFPSVPGRIFPNRRESIACPPSEPRGSVHNLQLDIMDDIVQARKVRMKLWNTSNERVCEVQPLDEGEAASVQRYTNSGGRRYSDFVGTTLAPIPSTAHAKGRRASELPPQPPTATTSASKPPTTGIVCSNTDLISILSSLSTSATEINNQCEGGGGRATNKEQPEQSPKTAAAEQKRNRLRSNRSNSFDVSILQSEESVPSAWLAKRHQPKQAVAAAAAVPVVEQQPPVVEKEPGKVMWDERSGSLVDAHALGSAIEVFLRQTTPEQTSPQSSPGKKSQASASGKSSTSRSKASSWFSAAKNDSADSSTETCDSSLCSTLKDLFVK